MNSLRHRSSQAIHHASKYILSASARNHNKKCQASYNARRTVRTGQGDRVSVA